MKKFGASLTLITLLVALGVWFEWPTASAPVPTQGATAAPAPSAASAPGRSDATDPTLTGGLEVTAPGAVMIGLQNKAIHRAFPQDNLSLLTVAAGDYDVFATGPEGSASAKVTIRAGETARVTLQLVAPLGAVNVTGTIKDSLGGIVPGAEVFLGLNLARTDSQGVFHVRVPKGKYDFRARAAGYADGTSGVTIRADATLDFILHPAASLQGVVVHADGSPAGGARVTVRDVADAFADAEGKFRLEGLSAGSYEVRAATATEIGVSPRVLVTPASSRDVRIEIGAAVTIVGRVLGADGAAIANAEVSLQADGRSEKIATAAGGADGTYRFSPVLPAQIVVQACAGEFLCGHSSQRFLTGGAPVTIDVTLRAGSSVRLTVLDPSGAPVEGAEAYVGQSEGCTSDAAGQCVIDHVTPHRTHLDVDHPAKGHVSETIDVSAGETLHTVRLVLGGTVRGTVRWDDGKPAADVFVQDNLFGRGTVARTGPDGRYELTNADTYEGRATLRAQATQHVTDDPFRAAIAEDTSHSQSVQRVNVKQGEVVEGVDFTLKRENKAIRGTVVDASGAPVASARVGAVKESPGVATMLHYDRFFQTPDGYSGPDGTFVLESLGEGSYAVWADAEDQSRGAARNITTGNERVVVKLPPPSSISGDVVDETGAPVKQFVVQAGRGSLPSRGDGSGHFALKGMRAGKLTLTVESAVGTASAVAEVPVETKEGEDTHVRVVMKRGVTVTGRVVVWPAMTPVSGVTVSVTDNYRRESMPTDASGVFTLEGLLPGTVNLYAVDVMGHAEHWKRNVGGQAASNAGDLATTVFEGYGGGAFDADGEHVAVVYPTDGLAAGDELLSIDGERVAKVGVDSLGYLMKNLRADQTFDVKKKSGETVTLHRSPPSSPKP